MKKKSLLNIPIIYSLRLYADNLRYVDHGVAKIESLINSYYQDNETAFIFTSDHGMTDWG